MARLHILGAGTPTPTADRFGTSYVLDLGGGRLGGSTPPDPSRGMTYWLEQAVVIVDGL